MVKKLLIMSVNGLLIPGILILSDPGHLFEGIDVIKCWTSEQVWGPRVKLNNSINSSSSHFSY
jgi:hypothetical protein